MVDKQRVSYGELSDYLNHLDRTIGILDQAEGERQYASPCVEEAFKAAIDEMQLIGFDIDQFDEHQAARSKVEEIAELLRGEGFVYAGGSLGQGYE